MVQVNGPVPAHLLGGLDGKWKGVPMNKVRLQTIVSNLKAVGIVYKDGERILRTHPMHKP